MVVQNMHIHSKYSWDSEMEIDKIAKILSENGIKYGAITDHVEFDREDFYDVFQKLKKRNLEIDRINEFYDGNIKLLKAVEISEPHLYQDEVKRLQELDLDFLMGSIHRVDIFANNSVDRQRATYLYYKELLKMVESNIVDVVGHLDYINRYYGSDYSHDYQINEVICAIKENNQIIEINTSAERRSGLNVFPDLIKIAKYRFMQKDITIGTDAHRYDELLDNMDQADVIVTEMGLNPVIYQKRKRINC